MSEIEIRPDSDDDTTPQETSAVCAIYDGECRILSVNDPHDLFGVDGINCEYLEVPERLADGIYEVSGVHPVNLSRDWESGVVDDFDLAGTWKLVSVVMENIAAESQHDLYETGDEGVPDSILDGNGEVVLGLCRRCNKAEIELSEPCRPLNRAAHPVDVEKVCRICDGGEANNCACTCGLSVLPAEAAKGEGWNDAIEAAAKVCDEISKRNERKAIDNLSAPNIGIMSGADICRDAIRALAKKET